jgi:hypothetical protein
MAYQVDRFNGKFLVSVEDGTIDTTTDLRFVGKNYAGYGEVQNENFLHLLESFANTTPPPKVISGQVWYDTANKKLKFYDGTRFKVAGGAEVSSTAPSGLAAGDFWWDTSAKQLYAWTGTEFTLIGPESAPDLGSSTISSAVVKGSDNVGPHTILKVFAAGKVVGIYSQSAFTLHPDNPITDFTVIKKGFTLAKSQTGISTDDYIMYGTAHNALYLDGVPASSYLRKGDNEFTGEVSFKDPGYSVGDGNDLRVRVENGDEVIVENRLGNPITFRITVAETTDERDVAIITSTGVVPGNDNTYSLGTALSKWNNIYSSTFTGNVVGNVTGNTTGSHTGNVLSTSGQVMFNASLNQIGYAGANLVGILTGSVTGSSGSATTASKLNGIEPRFDLPAGTTGDPAVSNIPIRDMSGNITARQFIGISDKSDRIRINNSATDPTIDGAVLNISSVPVADQYRTAKTTQTPWSIVARDHLADITARIFNGTATSARYADLAEKYLADKEYEPGTVVMVGGEKEVTSAEVNTRAIGVVSTNPAFMMNKDLEGGTYIALKGRVPCKVYGAVKKGDRLVAGPNGAAIAAHGNYANVFAVALETNGNDGVKTIEALVL